MGRRAFLDTYRHSVPFRQRLLSALIILSLGGVLVCLSLRLGAVCAQAGMLACGP